MDELIRSGLTVTAIGMSVVFVLLTLLVGIIHGMSALAAAVGGRPPAPAPAPATRGSPVPADDAELIAVISAAISAWRHRGSGS